MKKVERSLNVDILFDVLSRIPVKLLLGLKCISREWHSIISSTPFVKAHLQNTGLALTGFIFQEKFMWCKEDIKTISYIPVGRTTISAGSKAVHQTVFDFLPEDAVVLSSCKGLVCCRSCLPCSSEPSIYVCNPCNKEWIKIGWPSCDRNESIALAFDLDSSDNISKGCSIDMVSMRFKLVRVTQVEEDSEGEHGEDEERTYYLTFELYSSETKAWRKSNEICQCNNSLIKNKGLYIGGVLHWLTDGDQVLTFDVEKEMAWLIPVPVPAFGFRTVPEACIGEHEGKLNYVLISEEGLHVWCLEDCYEFKWTLEHWKSLEGIEAEFPQFFYNLKNRVSQRVSMDTSPWMNPLGFKDGVLLLKVCANLYLYDIENSKMSHACSLQDLDSKSMPYPTVFPHCLSLFSVKSCIESESAF